MIIPSPKIAVLCKQDLSRLEPGDKIHTHDKIMAIAGQAPVLLFTPRHHASEDMNARMQIVETSPQRIWSTAALILALITHRKEYDWIYSRDPLLMAFAIPLKIFRKAMAIELNGIPSIETEIRRNMQRVRVPELTPLICRTMRLLETLTVRFVNLVLPVTEKMRNTLLTDYGVDEGKVIVIPNSVDTTIFLPLQGQREQMRQKLGVEKATAILYLGTFSARWRGTEQLFRVADQIQREREDIRFIVVGSGPLLEEMKRTWMKPDTTIKTVFAGSVDHGSIPMYMSCADIYVYDIAEITNKLIKKQGLCPTKILEAMACGKPVIAPKETELENMLIKSGGGLAASSAEEMKILIERLADSPDLAKSMGVKARRYTESHHDLTRLTQRLIQLMARTGRE